MIVSFIKNFKLLIKTVDINKNMNSGKLNLGLKVEHDLQYNKVPEQRTGFNADREKSNTEKAMDDIFGLGPVKRKPRPDPTTVKQQTPSKTALPVVEQKKPDGKKETVPEPKPQPQPPVRPVKSVDQKPSIPNKQVPAPTDYNVVQQRVPNSERQGYNRPTYIRKLKKIAQDFEFEQKNQSYHSYQEVARPFDCERRRVQSLERLSEGNSFNDKEFPANSFSLGRKFWKQNTIWRRASSFCNRPTFGKYVEPNDIQIGQLSCPGFVSILSCLAERQSNIKRLIQNQPYNSNGFYYIRLNINSVWRYIAVDDFLPTLNDDNLGLLSFRDNQSEISLSLIEKAYAKVYSGYDVFQKKSLPEHYLRDLTGSRVARYELNDSNLLDNLNFSLEQNWTVVAVPRKGVEDLGLSSQYNLGIIGISSKGFELRNSWGTTTQKSKLAFSKQGIFSLTFQQAQKYLDYILVAQTDGKYHTSTIQSKHHSGFYSSYSFKVVSGGEAIISVSQWDHRLFPSQNNYSYSPFRLIIDRKNPGQNPEYVAGSYSHSGRNIDLVVELTPGHYTVFCIGSWGGSAYDYSVTYFGDHNVRFEKNYTQSFPNIIMKSLQDINLTTGKRSAKGHVDQYILYHQPTNLILLTNINISDKTYDYTQDLSKINFSTLTLLNSPNQEQNFSNKLEQEITSIKQDNNSDRRWSVRLQPKQAFTWVISTSQNYNLNNFKAWGFK